MILQHYLLSLNDDKLVTAVRGLECNNITDKDREYVIRLLNTLLDQRVVDVEIKPTKLL